MSICIPFKPQDAYPLTVVSVQVLPRNTERKFLGFQNTSTGNVLVQFSRDAAIDECLRIPPGVFVGFDTVIPDNEVYARGETGIAKLVVTEA